MWEAGGTVLDKALAPIGKAAELASDLSASLGGVVTHGIGGVARLAGAGLRQFDWTKDTGKYLGLYGRAAQDEGGKSFLTNITKAGDTLTFRNNFDDLAAQGLVDRSYLTSHVGQGMADMGYGMSGAVLQGMAYGGKQLFEFAALGPAMGAIGRAGSLGKWVHKGGSAFFIGGAGVGVAQTGGRFAGAALSEGGFNTPYGRQAIEDLTREAIGLGGAIALPKLARGNGPSARKLFPTTARLVDNIPFAAQRGWRAVQGAWKDISKTSTAEANAAKLDHQAGKALQESGGKGVEAWFDQQTGKLISVGRQPGNGKGVRVKLDSDGGGKLDPIGKLPREGLDKLRPEARASIEKTLESLSDQRLVERKFGALQEAGKKLGKKDLGQAEDLARTMRESGFANNKPAVMSDPAFYYYTNGRVKIPDQGIKLHLGDPGTPHGRQALLKRLTEAIQRDPSMAKDINFKITLFPEAVKGTTTEGKFVTFYTENPQATRNLAAWLGGTFAGKGHNVRAPSGDLPYGDSGVVFWRPGLNRGRMIKVPDGKGGLKEIPDSRSDPMANLNHFQNDPAYREWVLDAKMHPKVTAGQFPKLSRVELKEAGRLGRKYVAGMEPHVFIENFKRFKDSQGRQRIPTELLGQAARNRNPAKRLKLLKLYGITPQQMYSTMGGVDIPPNSVPHGAGAVSLEELQLGRLFSYNRQTRQISVATGRAVHAKDVTFFRIRNGKVEWMGGNNLNKWETEIASRKVLEVSRNIQLEGKPPASGTTRNTTDSR